MRPALSIQDFTQALAAAPGPDEAARAAAADRNAQLTKPPGALGRLEDLALWYAAWRGDARPRIARPQALIFAGNHGVAAQGVSAFPAEVTVQMVANFEAGGAAINQLCKEAGAALSVHPLDLETPTGDFTHGPAMSEAEFLAALRAGWDAVDESADLLVVGEMGIANTTSAAALGLALYGGAARDWVCPGTGIDAEGLKRKTAVIEAGLAANPNAKIGGLAALRCLGGREIAAMAGAMARARVLRIPLILDGFIATSAAACLAREVPGALDHAVAGHLSAEGGHALFLRELGLEPILSLGLRLGEGTGGVLAIQILKAALACHSGMATFAEAGVSDG